MEEQFGDNKICRDISFNEKLLTYLVVKDNKMTVNLKRKQSILEKKLKYFLYFLSMLLT